MVQVVDYEEFSVLKREVEKLQAENEFIKSLLLGERWLSRKQAMKALNCGHNKLRQLHVNNVLTYKYEGDRPYYDVFSIRNYLAGHRIDSKEADKRVLKAKYDS